MKLKDINITAALDNAKKAIDKDKTLSPSIRSIIELLMLIISMFMQKLGLNSANSSIPPALDPNRKKQQRHKLYNFTLLPENSKQHILEQGRFYLRVSEGKIVYRCCDPDGAIVDGEISQKDLPANVTIPEQNDLDKLKDIRLEVLKITQARGHTTPLKKPGGQPGHVGATLTPVTTPDEIIDLPIPSSELPPGYTDLGYVARQVVDIKISRHVTEYRAQVVTDNQGYQYTAAFPAGISRDVQYGAQLKSRVVFFSVYQMLPYQRIQEQIAEDYRIPMSAGSLANFIQEAANKLRSLNFDVIAKQQLINSDVAHADETSININGSKVWLHSFSNQQWAWLEPHEARGSKAMDDINIIPNFKGILCHDHWKPYFSYDCEHSLCNSHHIRELTWAAEKDSQHWAQQIRDFLIRANIEVKNASQDGLSSDRCEELFAEYRQIIEQGELECPEVSPKPGSKRKPKQSKSRNLLSRLKDYEKNVLMFLREVKASFTNNTGEREIRMSKVKLKVSGCFKNMPRAKDFFITKSYLQTCAKHDVPAMKSLELLFDNKLPDFIQRIEPCNTT